MKTKCNLPISCQDCMLECDVDKDDDCPVESPYIPTPGKYEYCIGCVFGPEKIKDNFKEAK